MDNSESADVGIRDYIAGAIKQRMERVANNITFISPYIAKRKGSDKEKENYEKEFVEKYTNYLNGCNEILDFLERNNKKDEKEQ